MLRLQQWQHVAATYAQSSGTANIYLDGNLVATTNLPGNPFICTTDDLLAGYRPSGVNVGSALNGSIDELTLYNRALSQAEILSIVTAGSSGKVATGPPGPGGITNINTIWLPQGPSPAYGGQAENAAVSNAVAGAVHAIAPHPANANTLFIGTVNGGVWSTFNAQSSSPLWTPLTDQLGSL